jgi:hypothetical protein
MCVCAGEKTCVASELGVFWGERARARACARIEQREKEEGRRREGGREGEGENLFLEGVLGDEAVDIDHFLLPNAVRPVHSLDSFKAPIVLKVCVRAPARVSLPRARACSVLCISLSLARSLCLSLTHSYSHL